MTDYGIAPLQVSKEELGAALRRMGNSVTHSELSQLFSYFDADNSGYIERGELMSGLRRHHSLIRMKICRRLFRFLTPVIWNGVVSAESLLITKIIFIRCGICLALMLMPLAMIGSA